MKNNNNSIVIIGHSNTTKEGVTLHLNRLAKLKTGNLYGMKHWVSWDEIGSSIFQNYAEEFKKLNP